MKYLFLWVLADFFMFLDLLWSPTTSDILILKSTINTTPFPWLAHNSVKFPISSNIEPLSCLASKPFLAPCYGYTTTITTHFPSTNISIRSHSSPSPLNVPYINPPPPPPPLTTTPTPPICCYVPRQIQSIFSTNITSPSPFILVSPNPITLISISLTTSTTNFKFLLTPPWMLTYPNITPAHPTPPPSPSPPYPLPHHTPHRFYFIIFITPLPPFIVYCFSHTHHKPCNPIPTRCSQPTSHPSHRPPHPPPPPSLSFLYHHSQNTV